MDIYLPPGHTPARENRAWAFREVLLVDDHALVAQALAGLIKHEKLALSVVTVGSLDAAESHLSQGSNVDLVLLDLVLDGEAGLALLPRLAALKTVPPVVIISSSEDESAVRAARTAGATGYLAKSAGRAALIRTMKSVRQGKGYFPGGVSPLVPGSALTPRQAEVLSLLAQGFPNKRICQSLGLTEHTVKTHLKAIFSHLGAHNRTECVARARAQGWL